MDIEKKSLNSKSFKFPLVDLRIILKNLLPPNEFNLLKGGDNYTKIYEAKLFARKKENAVTYYNFVDLTEHFHCFCLAVWF